MRTAAAALVATSLVLALAAPAGIDERLRGAAPSGGDDRTRNAAAESAPDGLLLLAVNPPERALVADPVTGRTTERVLPGGTLCHGPLLAIGDRVVYVGSRRGRAVALSAPLGRLGRARSLGPAELIVPSAASGRLWLGQWTEADHVAGRMSLREVDPHGRILASAGRRLPRWVGIDAHLHGGFLMTRGRGLVLRSPLLERARLRIRHGWVVAAGGERFAWCRGACLGIHVWDGRPSRFDPPAGLRPQLGPKGAFSPDGQRLALPIADSRLAVINLEHDTWTVVPGGRLGEYAAMAWSPSGRWLYFGGRRGHVLASRGGTERAVRLPIRTRGTVMSISTGGSADR